jgi:hypothetical protein
MKTFVLGGCLLMCCGLRSVCAQPPSDGRISTEVANLLQWKVFWEGPQSVANYQPGANVEATVVSSGDETAVFIQELRTAIYLTTGVEGISKRVIGGMPMGTEAASVQKYLSDKSGVPGLVLKPGAPEQPPNAPIRKEAIGQSADKPETHTVRLRLPALSPPEYILSKKKPAALEGLIAAAREKISGYHAPGCSAASVTIPFYSEQDPTVYVYVDFGKGCETGIFPFQRDRGMWMAGQFSPNRAPNEWSYTIGQVHKYSLSQFSLP